MFVAIDFTPGVNDLVIAFKRFKPSIAAKHIGAGLRRAAQPMYTRLKNRVSQNHRGPTGNLARAVAIKVKTYPRDGNAVALAGFVAAGTGKKVPAQGGKIQKGKDRAYHAGLVEFGTKRRRTKKPIASSFKELGPFKTMRTRDGSVRTKPAYPKAFLKRASGGRKTVDLPAMQAYAPIKKSYNQSKSMLKSLVEKELVIALDKAMAETIGREARGI